MASPHAQTISRRALSLLVILAGVLPLGGCWDALEVNDRAIVGALAFDQTPEGTCILWASILEPIQFRGQARPIPVRAVRGEGKSFEDALHKVQDQFISRLYMGHLHTLVISERLAKAGMTDVIAWFNRSLDRRLSQAFGITAHERLPQIMQTVPPGSQHSLVVVNESSGGRVGGSANLGPFLEDLSEAGRDPIAPINRPHLQGGQVVRDRVDFLGIGLFRNDRLVGRLEPDDSIPFLMLNNDLHKGTGLQSIRNVGKIERAAVTWQLNRVRRRVRLVNGRVRYEVAFDVWGRLSELRAPFDPYDLKEMQVIQEALGKALADEMRRVFTKLQATRVDPLGVGQLLHARYPRYWRKVQADWNENGYQRVELVIEPKVRLSIHGLQRKVALPPGDRNEETFGAKPQK